MFVQVAVFDMLLAMISMASPYVKAVCYIAKCDRSHTMSQRVRSTMGMLRHVIKTQTYL